MPDYPTVSEFESMLDSKPLQKIVEEDLFQGVPYVFRRRAAHENLLRTSLGNQLDVPPENITIVGSARLGFSLKPTTFGRKFSSRSDIDVVVVSTTLFDHVWLHVLRWSYPFLFQSGPESEWTNRQRFDIYRGLFDFSKTRFLQTFQTATFLKPVREVTSRWFLAFQALNRHREFVGLDVKGRLYRTWDHALYYHIENLRDVRAQLTRQKGTSGEVQGN